MKLYFSPGACCMSCHIALEEAKIPFELVYVGQHADEAVRKNFLNVNPLGAVPALELDNKKILTQNIAILEYIADQKPEAGLIEKAGTFELTIKDGIKKGTKLHGIYELGKTSMKICYAPSEKPRPTKFESPAGAETFCDTYERHKK